MFQLALIILVAFVAGALLTWPMRLLAQVLGVVDRPDGVRKLQRAPVPLLGGVAVFAAWIVGMSAGVGLNTTLLDHLRPSLFLAAAVILVTGILDDVLTLKPRWKLLGQALAAVILVASGLMVKKVWLFGYTANLGWLGALFTVVWLVGSMNALNMLDGLDGLASTIGLVICVALACMAWLSHAPALAVVTLALAGALLGFLLHNFPPARIYLGDSGSMLIGLVIGTTAIEGAFKTPATAALAAPILVLAIPIFDGVAAVIRRRLTGSSVSSPDRGHIHHRLQQRGWTTRQVLAAIAALCAVTGLAALVSLYFRSELMAVVATLAVVFVCVATKLFGHHEFQLLRERASFLRAALGGSLRLKQPLVLSLCCRVRQCRSVDEVWSTLVEGAAQLRLRRMQVRLNRPGLYQAEWEPLQPERDRPGWHTVLPLMTTQGQLGELSVWGYQQRRPVLADLTSMTMVADTLASVCDRLTAEEPLRLSFVDDELQRERPSTLPPIRNPQSATRNPKPALLQKE